MSFGFPLLLLSLVLASCSSAGGNCETPVKTGQFSLCLQEGWEQVSDAKLEETGVPAETVAAFHRTDEGAGERDNIVVSRERLPAKIAALAYAEANIKAIEPVPEYRLALKREVKIQGEVSSLHIFTARPVPDLPVRRFYQLSLTEGTTGYTFTGTLPFTVTGDEEQAILDMLLSVELQTDTEEE